MNISQIATLTNLSAKSIRLYESKGVITPPSRSENGYRQYGEQHIEELKVVARARRAGFSLEECKSLVELANNSNRTSAEVKQKAEHKLAEVEGKIAELMEIKAQLENWIQACPGDQNSACPIMDDLKKS
ncbi:Cu(I)-responsive transcriptional regulator [Vibrio sp. JC009]|uniref:Cu(I)-responsive transcriptional regulator n=1 Tax=Vibrio sp. JC009 TaxID=2912314 RepID=UPI0023AEEA5F|nr:Cu(I)-responsive transcriptional regulator [Vibrio sp. JC009]WED21014.1 Cu(I)-responsive transcriptional regulator [Vibrio sp. JC009]